MIFKEISSGDSLLLDARQGVGPGEESIQYSYWVQWPQYTSELNKVFNMLSHCFQNKKVYVFCHVGSWSGYVTDQLMKRGVHAVDSGAFSQYKAHKIPTILLSRQNLLSECP